MRSLYWKKTILQIRYGEEPTTRNRAKYSGEEEAMGGSKWGGEDIPVYFRTDPSGRPSVQLVGRETMIRMAGMGAPRFG